MQKIESSYGSDQHGLVWGYHFVPGQPAQPITSAAAVEFLATVDSGSSEEFLWLHFSLANSASDSWLRQNLDLPDGFTELLGREVGSTRLEQDDDWLVAVIHDVLFDFKFDASEISTASLCVGRRLLISARCQPLRSVEQLRKAVREGEAFRSPVQLLASLLQYQAGVLIDILRQSTTRVDLTEDQLLSNKISVSRGELGSLRRLLVRLQRLLAPEPAALFRLLNRPAKWIAEEDLQDLQQAAEEFATTVGDTAVMVERVKLIQEELAALVNEHSGRTLYILTVVTVLALPVNMVAGLLGMNVGGIPMAEGSYGFFLIVAGLLLLTALLAYIALKSRPD